MEKPHILLAEDDAGDAELIARALDRYRVVNEIVLVRDGEEALDCLHRRGPYAGRQTADPVLILLDLNMPGIDGLGVLKAIKAHPVLKFIPVVMLTSSRQQQETIESHGLGVNAYVMKPVDFEGLLDVVRRLGLSWLLVDQTTQP